MNLCECGICGLYSNPGRRFINGHHRKGQPSGMKGKHHSEKTKDQIGASNLGKKHTEATKEILRQASMGNKNCVGFKHSDEVKEKRRRIATINANKPEVIERQQAYKQLADPNSNFGFQTRKESYPESIFRKFLEEMGAIKGDDFLQEYRVFKPSWIEGHSFYLDFAFIDEHGKRNIEIDGGQHLKLERTESDRIRDEYLKLQGWQILRIPVKTLYDFLGPLWPGDRGLFKETDFT